MPVYPPPTLPRPPQRVVSLVPSLTESLFDLGLGAALAGVTDFCTRPSAAAGLPRLGGPKNPRLPDLLALKPDLVLANWEENTRPVVEAIQAAGVPVWVSFPCTVGESMEVLWELAGLFHNQAAALRLKTLDTALDWARIAAQEKAPTRYFCPIWYDTTAAGCPWWMTFNSRTYCHDVLTLAGGENVFAGRERRYPLEADLDAAPAQDPAGRDTRYPRLTLDEILAAQPEVVLLPDEPFAFEESHRLQMLDLLAGAPAARLGRIHLVDGSLITWHGTRLGKALSVLPALFAA